ncbi:MAG: carbohydrate-binding domain-containing protein [Alistipes sp.]|nr:carbohydrate-binding domain-containing protein [Alistipes sp.]
MSYIKSLSRLLLLVSLLYVGSCTMEWEEFGGDNTPTEQPNTPNEGDNSEENENEERNNNEDNTPSDGGNSNEGGENTPSTGDENPDQNDEGNGDEGNGGNNVEPAPDADLSITAWNGEWATDSGSDAVGSDKDLFYELNTFNNRVTVTYNGGTASVESNNSSIKSYITGAYVALDMTSVSGVEVVVNGKSSDGGLKIYSENKYKLTLNGVDITSKRGPAINSQAGKRIYLHLSNGTTNRLTDCATYGDDHYTMAGSTDEDRKGALFAEGHIIVSGYGALVVAGKYKHAIVTDGYYYQRPGTTVAVTEAAKNGIHVKGDSDDGIGAKFAGGLVYATVSGTAGKGIKCDMDIVVEGGKLNITTSGNATYDSEDKDTSSAAGLKSDTNINIKGGKLVLKSSGTGGKGISADADIILDGGNVDIATTGGQYKYSSQYTSSPKGIRADGNITINGGNLNISVTGKSEGSEGLESKNTITFNGGNVVINSYDDGINASSAMVVNGGRVYAYATNNDGIDSNGTITINGGVFIGIGSGEPEGGIDVDNSRSLLINGGYVLGIGGGMMGTPSTSSKQYSVVYGGASVSSGQRIALLDASSNMLFSFESPISMSATVCFSTPDIKSGSTYTVASGGSVSNYSECWQGWCYDGTWSGGSTLTTFTPSSVVTSIGSSSGGGPGGGGGGWPGGGGNRPW